MSVATTPAVGDTALGRDVLRHLDMQLESARRLLQIVLEQGEAIRERDVQSVVRYAGALQVEMQRRIAIEQERSQLLTRAGAQLGITGTSVTLELLSQLLPADAATAARERSAELRGLLEEVKREHTVNRALLHQELAFLDHLLRLVGGDDSGAYDAAGERPSASPASSAQPRRVFDLEV